VVKELPSLLSELPINTARASIMGHSMGGHGALTLYLRTLGDKKYASASAFAPICNPVKAPWGEKAFGGYLAGGVEEGKEYDATELIKKAKGDIKILIDVGTGDQFYQQKQREFSLSPSSSRPPDILARSATRELYRGCQGSWLLGESGSGQLAREVRPLVLVHLDFRLR
jgi:S-formylglutathione hydrolase FrmB